MFRKCRELEAVKVVLGVIGSRVFTELTVARGIDDHHPTQGRHNRIYRHEETGKRKEPNQPDHRHRHEEFRIFDERADTDPQRSEHVAHHKLRTKDRDKLLDAVRVPCRVEVAMRGG